MVNEIDDRLDESLTEFPGQKLGTGISGGRLSSFFSKFFSSNVGKRGRPAKKKEEDRLPGETIKNADLMGMGGLGVSRGFPKLPQIEQERKRRYKEYEEMDEYPEIGAAMDIYGDDSTQKSITGKIFEVEAPEDYIKEEIDTFFKNIRLREFIWDIVRNTAKYGDCFMENIVDLNNTDAGIQRVKILNPNYINRVENKYGYLQEFLQEVPEPKGSFMPDPNSGMGQGTGKFIKLDKEQIVHFRTHTSDPNYYPYGKSLLAPAVRAWKSLRLMEDAMLIYRLARAPERRVFYIDIGNLPTSKVEMFIERVKQKFKKEKFWDPTTGGISERYNPLSTDEDFFVPTRQNGGTKIETLPGAQNLGETDDVKYFRDKLLAALKVPKDYIVEKDKSPERKANLSQLDVKFARTVTRLQREVEIGLNALVRKHLSLRQFPAIKIKEVEITLCPPSDMFEKRRLELDEQKIRVVQAVKGLELFPDEWIYETYYQMSDTEINTLKEGLKSQFQEQMELDMEAQEKQQEAMGGMPGGVPPEEGATPEEGAPPEEGGGEEEIPPEEEGI